MLPRINKKYFHSLDVSSSPAGLRLICPICNPHPNIYKYISNCISFNVQRKWKLDSPSGVGWARVFVLQDCVKLSQSRQHCKICRTQNWMEHSKTCSLAGQVQHKKSVCSMSQGPQSLLSLRVRQYKYGPCTLTASYACHFLLYRAGFSPV